MKILMVAIMLALTTQTSLAAKVPKSQVIEIQVTEKGFEPNSINVKAGVPTILKVTRKTDATCATAIQIPTKKIKKDLPLNQSVSIDIGKLNKGEVRFACGMNMITGLILVQ